MRLKIETGEKQEIISVDDACTLKQLTETLKAAKLADGEFKIRSGFPPKPIDFSDPTLDLLSLGIRSGDKLIIMPSLACSLVDNSSHVTDRQQVTPSFPHVSLSTGSLQLIKIPEDNSCLFRSITVSALHGLSDPAELRSVVADTIRENREGIYDDAFLGRPRQEYIDWIIKPTSWGGAIELDILSKYLGISINSIDVETGRVDSFNPQAENFIVLMYSGVHYDTVELLPVDGSSRITNFVSTSEVGFEVVEYVRDLAQQLNESGYVTNMKTVKIRCSICKMILKGEKEASQHASETMHYEFGQV